MQTQVSETRLIHPIDHTLHSHSR